MLQMTSLMSLTVEGWMPSSFLADKHVLAIECAPSPRPLACSLSCEGIKQGAQQHSKVGMSARAGRPSVGKYVV